MHMLYTYILHFLHSCDSLKQSCCQTIITYSLLVWPLTTIIQLHYTWSEDWSLSIPTTTYTVFFPNKNELTVNSCSDYQCFSTHTGWMKDENMTENPQNFFVPTAFHKVILSQQHIYILLFKKPWNCANQLFDGEGEALWGTASQSQRYATTDFSPYHLRQI